LVCRQACGFGRESVIVRPGVYKIDRLTATALRKSQPHLIREKLLEIIEDGDDDEEPPRLEANETKPSSRARTG